MTEKILIIDDDIDTLKLVGLMLERQGYQIAVASNGTIGLSKAASERPDLILLDVMMPDIRSRNDFGPIPPSRIYPLLCSPLRPWWTTR